MMPAFEAPPDGSAAMPRPHQTPHAGREYYARERGRDGTVVDSWGESKSTSLGRPWQNVPFG